MTREERLLAIALSLMSPHLPEDFSGTALCRSISTSYYAAFSSLSSLIADTFTDDRQSAAWRRVFRGLNHGSFKKARAALSKLPKTPSAESMVLIMDTMMSLYDRRQQADYDPHYVATLGAASEAYFDASMIVADVTNMFKDDPASCRELVSLCLFPSERA
jgi:hypothetical protein